MVTFYIKGSLEHAAAFLKNLKVNDGKPMLSWEACPSVADDGRTWLSWGGESLSLFLQSS